MSVLQQIWKISLNVSALMLFHVGTLTFTPMQIKKQNDVVVLIVTVKTELDLILQAVILLKNS
jgi:hypothetical protein